MRMQSAKCKMQNAKYFLMITFIICNLQFAIFNSAYAADTPSKTKLQKTPETVEKGKLIYFKRCSFCHGLEGDGNGPAADFLDPRPRDFTAGTYKFRTTQSG